MAIVTGSLQLVHRGFDKRPFAEAKVLHPSSGRQFAFHPGEGAASVFGPTHNCQIIVGKREFRVPGGLAPYRGNTSCLRRQPSTISSHKSTTRMLRATTMKRRNTTKADSTKRQPITRTPPGDTRFTLDITQTKPPRLIWKNTARNNRFRNWFGGRSVGGLVQVNIATSSVGTFEARRQTLKNVTQVGEDQKSSAHAQNGAFALEPALH
jgi:hypothetical protein